MQGAQAQNIDSLYTVFSESRGQTRINAANEITRYVYENELIAELITLKTTDEEAKINAAVYESMGIYYTYQLANYDIRIDRKQSREGTAGEKGTGLGLIVCKEFLEKHGSTLHVESEAGKGSRFWFELSESSII